MIEDDIKVGMRITFQERIIKTSGDEYTHFLYISEPVVTTSKDNIVFEVVKIIEELVLLKVVGSLKEGDIVFSTKTIVKGLGNNVKKVKDKKFTIRDIAKIDNFKIHIDRDDDIFSDKKCTIEDIKIERLTCKECYDTLCKNSVCIHVNNKGTNYEECYDEFYFKAKNIEEAFVAGMLLYKNSEKLELPEMNEYSLNLFLKGMYTYDAALKQSKYHAILDWAEYLYRINGKREEKEGIRVWMFDTVGSCTKGVTIVVAKDKKEAVHTFVDYANDNDVDMLKIFSLEPTEEEELSSPLKEAKVVAAWYEKC